MRLLTLSLVMVLFGCAANDPLPPGYTGPRAYLQDTVVSESSSKARFFYASEIDGKRIRNSLSTTRQKSYGKGFRMVVEAINRNIPLRPLKVKLEGNVEYAAPILDIINFNKPSHASAIVEFEPVESATYTVRG